MAINFPSSPSTNDTYTFANKTWKWNGTAWEKSSATETGNTEGNTGEVAYYSGKGNDIAGATAFFYDGDKVGIGTSGPTETLDVRGGITASGNLYVGGGATFAGDVNFLGNAIIATGGYLQWPDGTTQDTRENITFQLGGSALSPTDEPHRTLDIRTTDQTDIGIVAEASQVDTARYVFSLGNNVPKLDESNTFTASTGNIFETPIGSNRYAGNNVTETAYAALDHASATYMGITSGTINYKILGTDILDMDTDIHAYVGISADAGATFGGPVQVYGGITASGKLYAGEGITCGGDVRVHGDILLYQGDIQLGQKSIKDGSQNPVLRVAGDRFVYIGDTDSSANDTKITVRDTHSTIIMDADSGIDLNTPNVQVKDDISHTGDSNTKINFTTDRIDFIVGGATAARISHVGGTRNPSAMLEAPFGITCGAGGTDYGSIYTPHGVTCGSLEVGGYWAGQHEEIIGISISGDGTVLTTGKKGHREIPYDCEVTQWTVTSTDSGSIQWDINWCTYANWATTASVAGSNLPSISSAYKNQDTSVNWTKTSFAAGDIIEFEIDTVSILTNCTLSLKIRRIG